LLGFKQAGWNRVNHWGHAYRADAKPGRRSGITGLKITKHREVTDAALTWTPARRPVAGRHRGVDLLLSPGKQRLTQQQALERQQATARGIIGSEKEDFFRGPRVVGTGSV
jgi:hypothetical protein